jgi:hypothetical protein
MSRESDQTDLYRLEPLQPRILLSADAEMLDAEVGTQDTFATVECELMIGEADIEGADAGDGRLYKGSDEEVFTDPDGVEYVQSDLYRTLEEPVGDDAASDDGAIVITCVPMDGEWLEPAPEEGEVVMTCFPMDGEWLDPELVDPAPDGIMYTMGAPAEEGEVVDEPLQNTYELAAPGAEAEVEILVIEEAPPTADTDVDAAVAPPADAAAPATADESNPLLSKDDDLLGSAAAEVLS